MTDRQWHATVVAVGPSADQHLNLGELIPGTTRFDTAPDRVTLGWRLEASTLAQATDSALRTARAALREAAGRAPELVDIRVRPAEEQEAETRNPPALRLWGYKETAEHLGVSRQRVAQLQSENPAFPAPVARLAAGPVFTQESIAMFKEGWARRGGRPRKRTA